MEATTDATAQAAENVELGIETLRGDIRDKILDDIARDMPCWTKLSEREQKKFISRADTIAYQLVRGATQIAAHQGFAHLTVSTGKWSVKDGIKLEVTASSALDDITKLAAHGSGGAVLVLAEASLFYGQRADAVFDKDQPDLGIDEEAVKHDEDGVITAAEEQAEAADEAAEGDGEDEADRSPLPEPPTSSTRSRRRTPVDAEA